MKKIIVILAALVVFVSCKPEERPSAIEDMVVSTINLSFDNLKQVVVKSDAPTLYMVGYQSTEVDTYGEPQAFDYDHPTYYVLSHVSDDTYSITPSIEVSAYKSIKGVITNFSSENVTPLPDHPMLSNSRSVLAELSDIPSDCPTYATSVTFCYNSEKNEVSVRGWKNLDAINNAYTIISVDAVNTLGDSLKVEPKNVGFLYNKPMHVYYWEGTHTVCNYYFSSFTKYAEINEYGGAPDYTDFSDAPVTTRSSVSDLKMNETIYLPNCTGIYFEGLVDSKEVTLDDYLPTLFETLNPKASSGKYSSYGKNDYKIHLHLLVDQAPASKVSLNFKTLTEQEVDVTITI